MVFKRLTINYFGKIEYLDTSFREQITEITAPSLMEKNAFMKGSIAKATWPSMCRCSSEV